MLFHQLFDYRPTPVACERTREAALEHRCCARVFTGDAPMIDGCGRTDFQNGDAATLYHSVQIFALPDDILVYSGPPLSGPPGEHGRPGAGTQSAAGRGMSLEEFAAFMAALDLPRPNKMDVAVPADRACGEIDQGTAPA